MRWIIFCLFFITGLLLYFPVMFIRRMNQIAATLEKIEANTRDLANLIVR